MDGWMERGKDRREWLDCLKSDLPNEGKRRNVIGMEREHKSTGTTTNQTNNSLCRDLESRMRGKSSE